MKKYTFNDIRSEGLLIYEYIRGSHAYGLNKSNSDVDTAGVYIEPIEQILGLGLDFQEEITDEKHDNVWFSLRKFMSMLLSSNPTVLESLFIPQDKIIYEHPIMTEIKKNRYAFITKECFKPFIGYAKQQIIKARGLNKKIVNPVYERLGPLDFCYTYYNQGSTKINNWLEHRGLKQKYCGLVNIPNMRDNYGVYYDFGNHMLNENITIDDLEDAIYNSHEGDPKYDFASFIIEYGRKLNDINASNGIPFKVCNLTIRSAFLLVSSNPIGYKGIVGEDGESNELRLSSIEKNAVPICNLSYNKDGYIKHCKDYKDYKDWEKYRNPERYKDNISNDKNYDCKNMCHSVRLMHMGLEIANTGEVNIDRTNIDKDFLMRIRNAEFSYDELISYLDDKKAEMEEAMNNSKLPEKIDVEFVNNLLLNIRRKQIENYL